MQSNSKLWPEAPQKLKLLFLSNLIEKYLIKAGSDSRKNIMLVVITPSNVWNVLIKSQQCGTSLININV